MIPFIIIQTTVCFLGLLRSIRTRIQHQKLVHNVVLEDVESSVCYRGHTFVPSNHLPVTDCDCKLISPAVNYHFKQIVKYTLVRDATLTFDGLEV